MSPQDRRAHLAALVQAFLVTMLWSSSWVLIKYGLKDIPAVTFVALRYGLATLFLVPFVLGGRHRGALFRLSRRDLGWLAALGLVQITLTQGAQVLSLVYLPATTASLVLTFTPAFVALLGWVFLGERVSLLQWGGIAAFLAGAGLYFAPQRLGGASGLGLMIAAVCLAANSAQTLIGRYVNRDGALPASVITLVSMGIGSAVLVIVALAFEGLPRLGLQSWLIIGWLAVVNTGFAFILWNHVQRRLTAMESSLINNTMLVPIAVLAVVFLGERLSVLQVAGLTVALLGVMAVQIPKLIPARAV